jgi:hypothetical protein
MLATRLPLVFLGLVGSPRDDTWCIRRGIVSVLLCLPSAVLIQLGWLMLALTAQARRSGLKGNRGWTSGIPGSGISTNPDVSDTPADQHE